MRYFTGLLKIAGALSSLRRAFGKDLVSKWMTMAKDPSKFKALHAELARSYKKPSKAFVDNLARQGSRDIGWLRTRPYMFAPYKTEPYFRLSHRHLDAIDPTGRLSKYMRDANPFNGGWLDNRSQINGRTVFGGSKFSQRSVKNGLNSISRDRSFDRVMELDGEQYLDALLERRDLPMASNAKEWMSKRLGMASDTARSGLFRRQSAMELPHDKMGVLQYKLQEGKLSPREFSREVSKVMYDDMASRGLSHWYLPKTRIAPSQSNNMETVVRDTLSTVPGMSSVASRNNPFYEYNPFSSSRLSNLTGKVNSFTVPGRISTPVVENTGRYFYYPTVLGHEMGHRVLGIPGQLATLLPTKALKAVNPSGFNRALLGRNPGVAAAMDNRLLQEYLASSFASKGGYSKWAPELKSAYDTYLLDAIRNRGLLRSKSDYLDFLKGWGVQTPV